MPRPTEADFVFNPRLAAVPVVTNAAEMGILLDIFEWYSYSGLSVPTTHRTFMEKVLAAYTNRIEKTIQERKAFLNVCSAH